MKTPQKAAFTLLEMIIAITVFTIFVGFAISTYLTFHRADQEALTSRSLMFEAQAAMDLLTKAAKENPIDYTYYNEEILTVDVADVVTEDLTVDLDLASDAIRGSILALRSPDGKTQMVYEWDQEAETLSTYRITEEGQTEPVLLHSESVRVSYVRFRIFPDENPYENKTQTNLQYQPTVRMELTFVMPGRIKEEVTVDLQTSVTSRFYQ